MIIAMSASTRSILPFSSFFFIVASIIISLGLCDEGFHGGCIPSESEALLKLKSGLKDPSNRLASWDSEAVDCCRWHGVICDNFTGHVLELHLSSTALSQEELADLRDSCGDFEEYLERSKKFGGKISRSLVNLKHLSRLDLSNNDFNGIHIAKFLGSMASLRYLNISGAGFGGMIPPQLGNLSNLQYLNLQPGSDHYSSDIETYAESLGWISSLSSLEFLDLSYVNLSKAFDWLEAFNKLPSLAELHLSNSLLALQIPQLPHVNFSSLAILDLSYSTDSGMMPSWIYSFPSLASLDLTGNNLGGPIPVHLQNLTYVRELHLSDNNFNSSIPSWLSNFTHLQLLDLGGNYLEGEIPSGIGKLTALSMLDFSNNRLEGEIPSAIGNLSALTSLDLSYNQLEGGIPTSFVKLCHLSSLSLFGMKLSQDINEVIEIISRCVSGKLESMHFSDSELSGHSTNLLGHFKNLTVLDLSENLFRGQIPMSIGEMTSLKYLDLSGNKLNGSLPLSFGSLAKLESLDISQNLISGQIPMSIGEMTSLKYLDLSSNKLNGSLPLSFGRLAKLDSVGVSHNSLKGVVSENHFTNLKRLGRFDASENHLILRVNPDWVPPFQLVEDLNLRCWELGPQFPTWLPHLKRLRHLDLSNSKISSILPSWFHNFSSTLYVINLSHNQMHGRIQNLSIVDSSISSIDLSSNYFEGPLPYLSSNRGGLDLSNNFFSGSMTNFLCNKVFKPSLRIFSTQMLNLKENHLSGEIPDCWMHWNILRILDLSSNNFSGNIPESIGSLWGLVALNLRNNKLYGEIPLSLSNCKLRILDLGENELEGEIPSWIGRHLQMRILNFRGNKFHGHILDELCNMAHLQILDLANNNLNSTIPTCLNNLLGMFSENGTLGTIVWAFNYRLVYKGGSSILRKGQMVEYSTTLGFVRSLDLSNNQLFGEIPQQLTSLDGLQTLNLSHNFLTGRIPENMGAMKALESLDLSQNRLFGEIPQSMSSLSFLSNLNLSNNNLSGQIPSSTQLQSLDSSSFSGNNLCGPPLLKDCRKDEAKPPSKEEGGGDHGNEDEAVDWFYFYVCIAPGFVVGFWGVMGPLAFNRRWRHIYFEFLGRLWDNMWVWFHVNTVRFVKIHG